MYPLVPQASARLSVDVCLARNHLRSQSAAIAIIKTTAASQGVENMNLMQGLPRLHGIDGAYSTG